MASDKGSFSIRVKMVDEASSKLAKLNKNLAASQRPMKRLNAEFKKFGDLTGIKSVTQSIEKFTESAAKAGLAMAGIAGVASVAGLFSMAQAFASAGKAATNTAMGLGISTGALYKFETAAKFAGIGAGEADAALAGLQKTAFDAKWGNNSKALNFFKTWKIGLDDDIPTKMNKLAKAFADPRFKDPALAKMALERAGLSPDMLPLIRGWQKSQALTAKYGLSEEDAKKAADAGDRLKDALNSVEVSGGALGSTLMTELEPAITPLLSDFADWLKQMQQVLILNKKTIQDHLKEYLNDIGAGFKWLKDNLPLVEKAFAGLIVLKVAAWGLGIANAFISVASAIRTLMMLNPTLTAALAAAGAVYLAYTTNKAAYDDYIQEGKDEKKSNRERAAQEEAVRNLSPEKRAAFDALQAKQGLNINQKPLSPLDVQRRSAGLPTSIGGAAGRGTSQEIMKSFLGLGYTPVGAAGWAANAMKESGGNASAQGDKVNGVYTAYGAFQLHKDRQDRYKAWAGHDIREGNLDEQIRFMDYELHHQERGALSHVMAAKTAYEAAGAISKYDIRPKAVDAEMDERGNMADSILSSYGQQQRVNGQVGVNVAFANAPPGTSAMAKASGDILGPPVVNMGMPMNTF